jgi:hypothetical protein
MTEPTQPGAEHTPGPNATPAPPAVPPTTPPTTDARPTFQTAASEAADVAAQAVAQHVAATAAANQAAAMAAAEAAAAREAAEAARAAELTNASIPTMPSGEAGMPPVDAGGAPIAASPMQDASMALAAAPGAALGPMPAAVEAPPAPVSHWALPKPAAPETQPAMPKPSRRVVALAWTRRLAIFVLSIALLVGGVMLGSNTFLRTRPAPTGGGAVELTQPPADVAKEFISALAAGDSDAIRSSLQPQPNKDLTDEFTKFGIKKVTGVETLGTSVQGTRSATEVLLHTVNTDGNTFDINLIILVNGNQIEGFR